MSATTWFASICGILVSGLFLVIGMIFGVSIESSLWNLMILMAVTGLFLRLVIGWLAIISLIALSFTILLSIRMRDHQFASYHQWITSFIMGGTTSLVIAYFYFNYKVFVGAVMTVPFVLGMVLLSAMISHLIVHEKTSKIYSSLISKSDLTLKFSSFSVLLLSLILILPNLSAVAGLKPEPPSRPSSGYGSGIMPYEVESFSVEASYPTEISDWWYEDEVTRNWKVHVYLPVDYDSDEIGLAIFLHGFSGTDIENYHDTMVSLAGQGLVAIFPEYASEVDYSSVDSSFELVKSLGSSNNPAHLPRYTMALEGIDLGLQYLESNDDTKSTLGNTSIDYSHLWVGGHSMGSGTSFYIVSEALKRGWGNESLVMNLEAPWIHAEDSDLRGDMSLLPDHALINIIEYEADTTVAECLGRWHHDRLINRDDSNPLPDDQVRFVLVQNDYHGFPPLVASHFQQISFIRDSLANIAYYPRIEAQSDYISSMVKGDLEGAESARVAFMESNGEAMAAGNWSDGTPVNPLLFIPQPLVDDDIDWNKCPS
mgnify:CR=1 FL=1